MPRTRYRAIGGGFCAVKVKLTTGLEIGAGLLVSAHSIARRPARRGEVVTRGAKQSDRRAGRGGDVTPGLARKISADEGGPSQGPPFFFGRNSVTGVFEKSSARFRCRYRNCRDVI